jgi:hypothetical protein
MSLKNINFSLAQKKKQNKRRDLQRQGDFGDNSNNNSQN